MLKSLPKSHTAVLTCCRQTGRLHFPTLQRHYTWFRKRVPVCEEGVCAACEWINVDAWAREKERGNWKGLTVAYPEEQNANMSWKSGRRYAEMRSVCMESTQCVQLPRKQQMLTLVLSVPLLFSSSSCSLLCCSSPFLTAACWREGTCVHMHTHTQLCTHTYAHTHTHFPRVTHAGSWVNARLSCPTLAWGIGPLNPSRAPHTHL